MVLTAFSLMELSGKLEIQEGGLLPSTIVHWKLLMVSYSGEESRSVPLDPQELSPEKLFSSEKGQCPHPPPTIFRVGGCAGGETETTLNSLSVSSRLDWLFLEVLFPFRAGPQAQVQVSRESVSSLWCLYTTTTPSWVLQFLHSWIDGAGNYPARLSFWRRCPEKEVGLSKVSQDISDQGMLKTNPTEGCCCVKAGQETSFNPTLINMCLRVFHLGFVLFGTL